VIRAVDAEIQSVRRGVRRRERELHAAVRDCCSPAVSGKLKLTEPDDLLDTGIEVEAKPSGKNVKKLSLLSGGERSLTALAFLFAVFRSRPSPFYVMDEVEAALDDVNLHRFLGLVEEFRKEAQLLDREPPEAHDGGRRLPARRQHAARRLQQGGHRTRHHRRLSPAELSPPGPGTGGQSGGSDRRRPVASAGDGSRSCSSSSIAVVAFGIGVLVVSRRNAASRSAPPSRPPDRPRRPRTPGRTRSTMCSSSSPKSNRKSNPRSGRTRTGRAGVAARSPAKARARVHRRVRRCARSQRHHPETWTTSRRHCCVPMSVSA
jgi:hypothetical protein